MNITKAAWGEMLRVLKKHKIPYVAHLVSTGTRSKDDDPESEIVDNHIQINIIVSDYMNYEDHTE